MAYTFNGTNQYLTGASAPVTAMPLTIACWFKLTTSPPSGNNVILQVSDNTTSTANVYRLIVPAAVSYLRAAQVTNGTSVSTDSASGAVVSNAWTHGAGVFSSTTSRTVWVNGSLANTSTASSTAPTVKTMSFGCTIVSSTTASAYLSGSLAEIGVWSAALSADEMLSLSRGVTPDKVRPQSLAFYAPLVRNITDMRNGISLANVNAATVSDHPRVYA